ncbi:hypothetical protein [Bacillus cereus]|uniref:hypothetical protein n=2 Tax=Bacillus cereus TaxID=1396 RepID=UPI000BF26215|nr:hypothetical protein [Bacillus cereus]PFL52940.1 hypothetical protein COJ33_15390 [Bacillus cereus]PFN97062.1 hypothetical protein COJ63_27000 [Bacillus cereus]PFS30759.1 hypothetical protein COK47_15895 [Bacillus cereus]PGU52094.1 hypothetical protein COD72_22530 [Bacillus cereus]
MFKKLLLNKRVHIIDGDNRLDASSGELKVKLKNMLDNGMYIKGIQIFHYASIHYNSRWESYPLRFLNALLNSAATIQDKENNLCLSDKEESELQRDSSEVLGIGLSNIFMCKWYGININRVEKIGGAKKRCDYRFGYNNQVIIFEAKGRKNSKDIKSALNDCIEKKSNYSANSMYSTICHLPRNGEPVCLHLFDPPVNDESIDYNDNYVIANHYKRVTEKAGLTVLSSSIEERIKRFEESGIWDTVPINSNVLKIGYRITIGNNDFWTRRSSDRKKYDINIHYGIDKKVIELLEKWDLSELKKLEYNELVTEDKDGIFSILSDGSLLYIGNEAVK